ncbi:hypothetical protein BSKO_07202 [Bryopsis sp. KO-2023]|nr:hypothetical protein BSKO_07202 [Bryopsis sp. KO-2023]
MAVVNGVSAQDPPPKITSLLEEFQNIQSTRAETYTLLHEGFRDFLKSKDEAPFVKSMADATQVFKKCSQEVIRIEKVLRETPNAGELADLLRSVQEGERSKLKATMALQSLRRVYEVEKFSWQQLEPPPSVLGADPHTHQHAHGAPGVSDVTSGISFINLENGSVDINRVDGGEGGEPSRWDYDGAVGEATHMLDSAINRINEVLEEIRYARVDFEEGDAEGS